MLCKKIICSGLMHQFLSPKSLIVSFRCCQKHTLLRGVSRPRMIPHKPLISCSYKVFLFRIFCLWNNILNNVNRLKICKLHIHLLSCFRNFLRRFHLVILVFLYKTKVTLTVELVVGVEISVVGVLEFVTYPCE